MHSKQGFLSFLGYEGISGLRREINVFPSPPPMLGLLLGWGCEGRANTASPAQGTTQGPGMCQGEMSALFVHSCPSPAARRSSGAARTPNPTLPGSSALLEAVPASRERGQPWRGASPGNGSRKGSRKIHPAKSQAQGFVGPHPILPQCPAKQGSAARRPCPPARPTGV